ncbi:hypothetical protein [Methylobacterium segetis]|uniref:hypothetical protein n=1 Tax=Methylobacterium segetis TaxID=2488750 RepID=UPI00104DC833|nr:hypothetical protein [Methylobacterium segetis]
MFDRRLSAHFKIVLALLVVLVLLSAPPFPGAMIGFLFGIAIAFSIAPLTILLEGPPCSPRARHIARARSVAAAVRLSAARALLLIALPLIAWLSSRALIRAWP